jgi:hypothetical protein
MESLLFYVPGVSRAHELQFNFDAMFYKTYGEQTSQFR